MPANSPPTQYEGGISVHTTLVLLTGYHARRPVFLAIQSLTVEIARPTDMTLCDWQLAETSESNSQQGVV